MKNLITLLLGLIVSNSPIFSQDNHGFYGKKNYLELHSATFIPVVYPRGFGGGLEGANKVDKSGELVKDWDWFHSGIRLTVGRTFKTRFGMSLEFGFDRLRIFGTHLSIFTDDNYGNLRATSHENIKVNAFTIMPKFEFGGKNGLLPNGIVHQLGFGIVLNKPIEADYLVNYTAVQQSGGTVEVPDTYKVDIRDHIDFSNTYRGFKFMYSLKKRLPLSKSFLLSYGIRYTVGFGAIPTNEKHVSMVSSILRFHSSNLVAFDIGIALPY